MDERRGHFTEPPILPEVPAPPPDRILVRGARLARIYGERQIPDVRGRERRGGGRDAVILAWARRRDGWAVLLAWTSYYMYEDPPKQTEAARWGWYVLDEQRVKPMRAPRASYEGAAWHGWHQDSELNVAIERAALLLPAEVRERAKTPMPDAPADSD
jgi:hypothetical protein